MSQRPSKSIAHLFDQCPVTDQRQYAHKIYSTKTAMKIITRGKTTAWRHTILSEEIDINNLPSNI